MRLVLAFVLASAAACSRPAPAPATAVTTPEVTTPAPAVATPLPAVTAVPDAGAAPSTADAAPSTADAAPSQADAAPDADAATSLADTKPGVDAAADQAPGECASADLVWLAQAEHETFESWRAVVKAVSYEPPEMADEAAARAYLCRPERDDEGPWCKPDEPAWITWDDDEVQVYYPSKGVVAAVEVVPLVMGGIDIHRVEILDERWVAAVIQVEVVGHDVIDDDCGEEECMAASYVAGHTYAFVVIDRKAEHAAWMHIDERWAQEHNACTDPMAIALAGDSFALTYCGRTIKYTLDEIRPCTPEVHHKLLVETFDDDAEREALGSDPKVLVDEARKLTKKGDYAGAEARFDRALELAPGDAKALSGRGYARLLDGRRTSADDDFAAALAACDKADKPDGPAAAGRCDAKYRAAVLFNRGLVREGLDQPAEAKAFFQQAHDLAPSAATAKKLGLPAPKR